MWVTQRYRDGSIWAKICFVCLGLSILTVARADAQDFQEAAGVDGPGIDMIIVEPGEFTMGSPATESGRAKREGPQQSVSISKPLAISRTEISVGQFASFVAATGYVTDVEKRGSGEVFKTHTGRIVDQEGINWRHDFRGNDASPEYPVIRVSWQDAQAFAAWLSKESGRPYRLLSESEFEYALRAGTSTRYWWGDGAPDRAVENITGDRERLKDLRWPVGFPNYTDRHWGPAPVGSFEPNPFGLFDMGGNAAEWVQDCYTESLSDVPTDGAPVSTGACDMRVFKGGAWGFAPPLVRSAYRNAAAASHVSTMISFRIATDVTGPDESQARR